MHLYEVVESILMVSEDKANTLVLNTLVEMLLKSQKPTLRQKKPYLSVLTEGSRSDKGRSKADTRQTSASSVQLISPVSSISTLLTEGISPKSSLDFYEVRRRSRAMTDELSMCKE
jgi:hypothetical protein